MGQALDDIAEYYMYPEMNNVNNIYNRRSENNLFPE